MINLKLIAFNIQELDDAAKKLTNITADSSVWQLRLAGVPVAKPELQKPELKAQSATAVTAKMRPGRKPRTVSTRGRQAKLPADRLYFYEGNGKSTRPLDARQIVSRVAREISFAMRGYQFLTLTKKDEKRIIKRATSLLIRVLKQLPKSPESLIPIECFWPDATYNFSIRIVIFYPENLDRSQLQNLRALVDCEKTFLQVESDSEKETRLNFFLMAPDIMKAYIDD